MTSSRDGVVALVTGGASGIGQATVRLFLEKRATVFAADINEDALASVTDGLRSYAPHLCPLVVDVSSSSSCEAMISAVIERAGRLDVLVNSAGVWTRAIRPRS